MSTRTEGGSKMGKTGGPSDRMGTAKAKIKTKAQQMKARAQRNAVLRAVVQAIFFVTMPGTFVAGFSGIKNIYQHIANGSMLEFNSFVKVLVGLCLFTVLFGRFFCGFACAFGSFGDLVFAFSGVIQKHILRRKKQIEIPSSASVYLQKIKFLILAAIVVLCALGLYDRLGQWNWNPWSVFSFLVAMRFNLDGYKIGTALLILIVLGMAFKERFFCQYLCPLGAVFALLPQLPFTWLHRDIVNCPPACQACKKKCPVDLKLETDGFCGGECISCEKCAGICPRSNLTRYDIRLLRHEAIPVIIKTVLLLILGVCLGVNRFVS